ncbi:unnamed protein product, partial [Ectocarpus sp. 6 AP-2014]
MSSFGSFEMVFGKYWDHWRYSRSPNGPLCFPSNGGGVLSYGVSTSLSRHCSEVLGPLGV